MGYTLARRIRAERHGSLAPFAARPRLPKLDVGWPTFTGWPSGLCLRLRPGRRGYSRWLTAVSPASTTSNPPFLPPPPGVASAQNRPAPARFQNSPVWDWVHVAGGGFQRQRGQHYRIGPVVQGQALESGKVVETYGELEGGGSNGRFWNHKLVMVKNRLARFQQ
jgi:hypothetical protein